MFLMQNGKNYYAHFCIVNTMQTLVFIFLSLKYVLMEIIHTTAHSTPCNAFFPFLFSLLKKKKLSRMRDRNIFFQMPSSVRTLYYFFFKIYITKKIQKRWKKAVACNSKSLVLTTWTFIWCIGQWQWSGKQRGILHLFFYYFFSSGFKACSTFFFCHQKKNFVTIFFIR